MDPHTPRPDDQLVVYRYSVAASRSYLRWLRRVTRSRHTSVARLIRDAVAEYCERRGIDPPPDR